ncbi:hypothetical protein DXO015_20030 [Xanthomonas oryzae pv. oryzae]|nr:hypothetical protein DXO015_20030 [Xanthomonas oryzae pv. oryzae]
MICNDSLGIPIIVRCNFPECYCESLKACVFNVLSLAPILLSELLLGLPSRIHPMNSARVEYRRAKPSSQVFVISVIKC